MVRPGMKLISLPDTEATEPARDQKRGSTRRFVIYSLPPAGQRSDVPGHQGGPPPAAGKSPTYKGQTIYGGFSMLPQCLRTTPAAITPLCSLFLTSPSPGLS